LLAGENVIRPVSDIPGVVSKCERFQLYRFFGYEKTFTYRSKYEGDKQSWGSMAGLPLVLATSAAKRGVPSKWRECGKEHLRAFWRRHAEVHRQFMRLSEEAESGAPPPHPRAMSVTSRVSLWRNDARLRDALLLGEQVRETVLSFCATCWECFVAGDLYHPVQSAFPEPATFMTADLPELPRWVAHRWADSTTGEILTSLPAAERLPDGTAATALRWALGELNRKQAYHLLPGDRCSVKIDLEKREYVVSVTRWGISVQRTCKLSSAIRDDGAFAFGAGDPVKFVLGTGAEIPTAQVRTFYLTPLQRVIDSAHSCTLSLFVPFIARRSGASLCLKASSAGCGRAIPGSA
jgi:hypothetical protein